MNNPAKKSWWKALSPAQATVLVSLVPVITAVIGSIVTFSFSHLPGYVANPSSDFRALVDKARKVGNAYVLQNVTMHVQIDESPGDGRRVEKVRIIYYVHALKDIQENDRAFQEEYSSGGGSETQIQRWYGPNVEDLNDVQGGAANIYNVFFKLREGQNTTVITGANFLGSPNIAGVSMFFSNFVNLRDKESIWQYKNDDDFIHHLDIIIESTTIDLQRVDFGLLTLDDKGRFTKTDNVVFHSPQKSTLRQRCLYASWDNVLPHQVVGILYGWN